MVTAGGVFGLGGALYLRGIAFDLPGVMDGDAKLQRPSLLPPPVPAPPTLAPRWGNATFGSRAFAVWLSDGPASNVQLDPGSIPLTAVVLYKPLAGEVVRTAPLLLVWRDGDWTPAAGTCGGDARSSYDAAKGALEMKVCRLGVFALYFQTPPVPSVAGPAVVQAAVPPGAVTGAVTGAVAHYSGAGSVDPDSPAALVWFRWVVRPVPGSTANADLRPLTVNGPSLDLPAAYAVPGVLNVTLSAMDAQFGVGTTSVSVSVNTAPVAAVTAALHVDGASGVATVELSATGTRDAEDQLSALRLRWLVLPPGSAVWMAQEALVDGPAVQASGGTAGVFTASAFPAPGTYGWVVPARRLCGLCVCRLVMAFLQLPLCAIRCPCVTHSLHPKPRPFTSPCHPRPRMHRALTWAMCPPPATPCTRRTRARPGSVCW